MCLLTCENWAKIDRCKTDTHKKKKNVIKGVY